MYDENGNIKEMRNGFNNIVAKYEYDELDRITTETNEKGQKTEYGYDNNGNILYKKSQGSTIPYVYAGDRLLSYNNEKCVYDSLGNPTTYRGKPATWSHLRNLASYGGFNFSYDAGGLRTLKRQSTSTNTSTSYTWSNGKLLRENRRGPITATIDYIYSSDGIIGFYHNTTPYYYIKNLQGDVTAVVNQSGAIQARYTYDAFGNHTVLNPNNTPNTKHDFIGNVNPIRYRSYYFDTETGFYYLKSRYYDPQVGRFINADGIDEAHDAKGIVNGLNLYSYCNNNPVMHRDDDGDSWWKWLVGAVVVAVAAVAVVVTGGAAAGLVGAIAAGALKGAVAGAISGAVVGGLMGGVSSAISGGSFWSGLASGAADGFMMGAITGAILGGINGGLKFGTFQSKDLLNSHFSKHGTKMRYANSKDYASGAKYLIKEGTKVSYTYKGKLTTGYIKFFGEGGGANYAFVGMRGSRVATFGIRSVKELSKFIPWLVP